MLTAILAKLLPPQFPKADVVVVDNLSKAETREGFRELPDCPARQLGELREWHKGRYTVITTQRT